MHKMRTSDRRDTSADVNLFDVVIRNLRVQDKHLSSQKICLGPPGRAVRSEQKPRFLPAFGALWVRTTISDAALTQGKQTHHHDKNFTCSAAPRVDGRSPRKASRHMVAPAIVRPVSAQHVSGGNQGTNVELEVMPRLLQTHECLIHVESRP